MPFRPNTVCLFIVIILVTGCGKQQPADTLFEQVSSKDSGLEFVNTVENTEDFNIFSYRNFYNGGGAAIGDVNNDGLSDIYLTSNMGDNKLFLNKGNFQFEDITSKAGVAGTGLWSTGVVMVDINADGLLDIFVCNAGYDKEKKPVKELFINQGMQNGVPVFQEKAAEYGLNEDGYTTHAAFFDYDLDGDLDCYILNNSFMPVNTLNYSNNREMYAEDWPVRDFLKGGGDKLLRNDNGKFVNVTREAKIYGSLIGFGLGITVGDVNGDNWPDLYVSNDFFERDYLYINQKDGTFKEEIEQWISHMSHASMGADMADINNDGYPEIFTTEMLPGDETRLKTTTLFENYSVYQLKQERGFYHQYMQNCLQLNNKDKTFSEIAFYSGVAATDWSWGALMFDMDNDGYRDLYVCNGIYKDVTDQDFIDFFADEVVQKMALTGQKEQINEVLNKMPSKPQLNKAFHNRGDLTFEDAGTQWGFTTPSFSNGAAYGDLDNDGDLDLVINNVNQEALLYKNHSKERNHNHHLTIRLKGKGQNTFAVGAQVSVHQGAQHQQFQLIPSRGFQSSVDYKMVFGLGQNAQVDSVVIVWPDRSKTVQTRPAIDTTLLYAWENAGAVLKGNLFDLAASGNKYLKEIPSGMEQHRENNFVDFYQENLTFRMLSREGPKAAVADVNGDKRDDVYIGGASGQGGQLYLQTPGGAFGRSRQQAFDRDSLFEDTAVLFFDADEDGDQDLFVGSGGNEQPMNSPLMSNRLYMNDGKGNFTLNQRALPPNGFNTAVAIAYDFNEDGHLDLFVGNRSVPAQYGVPPRHFIYKNDGKGNFTDVSRSVTPDLQRLGMVTDAVMANVTGDSKPELIIVGEWRNPIIFEINKGEFTSVNSNLNNYSGWWYTIQADDVDGDGDQDLIMGNRGENFYFSAAPEQPSKLWISDFDQNGTVEKIVTRSINGKDMPVPMKKDLTGQIPSLKKQNLKHVDYAQKSIQELFTPEVMKSAIAMPGNYFKSVVALNEGNGQFKMMPLPKEVQFSCVCDIWCGDLNKDGKNDLVMAGNDAGFMPQFSKLDAGFGYVLLNRGNGAYERVENRTSGFSIRGDVKSLQPVTVRGKKYLLATVNKQTPRLYEIK